MGSCMSVDFPDERPRVSGQRNRRDWQLAARRSHEKAKRARVKQRIELERRGHRGGGRNCPVGSDTKNLDLFGEAFDSAVEGANARLEKIESGMINGTFNFAARNLL